MLSWSGAWLLLQHSPAPAWLPWAVALGVLTHIAGDAITAQGVPVPLVWLLKRCRLVLTPLRTGAGLEKAVLVPLFVAATLWFVYLHTGVRSVLDPLIQDLQSLG